MSKSLGLSSNPFDVSIAGPEVAIWADREEEKRKLDQFIESVFDAKFTQTLIVIGDYGMGKTHCLRYVKFAADKNKMISIMVDNPGTNFVELYKKFIQQISRIGITRLVDRLLSKIHSDVFSSIADSEIVSFRADVLTLESILKNAMPLVDRDFLRFLSGYATNKNVEILLRWLNCGKLLPSELKMVGLSENILSAGKAFEVMKGFFLLFNKLRIPSILLIDEFEDLVLPFGPSSRVRTTTDVYEYFFQMRHLIDENLPRNGLVISMTTHCWNVLTKESLYPALVDRFRGNLLFLDSLHTDQIRSFIQGYLNSTSRKIIIEQLFEEEALKLISNRSGGNPRRIIQICREAVEYARKMNLAKISRKCVDLALKDLNKYYEE